MSLEIRGTINQPPFGKKLREIFSAFLREEKGNARIIALGVLGLFALVPLYFGVTEGLHLADYPFVDGTRVPPIPHPQTPVVRSLAETGLPPVNPNEVGVVQQNKPYQVYQPYQVWGQQGLEVQPSTFVTGTYKGVTQLYEPCNKRGSRRGNNEVCSLNCVSRIDWGENPQPSFVWVREGDCDSTYSATEPNQPLAQAVSPTVEISSSESPPSAVWTPMGSSAGVASPPTSVSPEKPATPAEAVVSPSAPQASPEQIDQTQANKNTSESKDEKLGVIGAIVSGIVLVRVFSRFIGSIRKDNLQWVNSGEETHRPHRSSREVLYCGGGDLRLVYEEGDVQVQRFFDTEGGNYYPDGELTKRAKKAEKFTSAGRRIPFEGMSREEQIYVVERCNEMGIVTGKKVRTRDGGVIWIK